MLPFIKSIFGLFGKGKDKGDDLKDPDISTFTYTVTTTILSPSEKEKLFKKFFEDNFKYSIFSGKDSINNLLNDDIKSMIKKDRKDRRFHRHMRRFYYKKIKYLKQNIDTLNYNKNSLDVLDNNIRDKVLHLHNMIITNLLIVNIMELEYKAGIFYRTKIDDKNFNISTLNRKIIILNKYFTILNLFSIHSLNPDNLKLFLINPSEISSSVGYNKSSVIYNKAITFLDMIIDFLNNL